MQPAEPFTFIAGTTPLLISVPHDGRRIPDDIRERMTPVAHAIPDTDWHVAALYDFARELGASMLIADYSRYVIDLNRGPDDDALYPGRFSTGLCPEQTFAGEALYLDGARPEGGEVEARLEAFWRPYHARIAETLADLGRRHDYALLWDAHSIPGRVPTLFDGRLPDLNIGSYDGRSAALPLIEAVAAVADSSDYSFVVDGRFKGGYITRHYGAPRDGIHAIQLEIAQRSYMDEETQRYDAARAAVLQRIIGRMLEAYRETAQRVCA